MKTGMDIETLQNEVLRQANAKKDFLSPAGQMKAVATVEKGANIFGIQLENFGFYPTTKLANQQLAAYTGIPNAYFNRMEQDAPGLLAANVNRWLDGLGQKGDRRLARTLDGKLRAVLSDRFPVGYDNFHVAQAVLPIIRRLNLEIVSADITETKLYIKALDAAAKTQLKPGQAFGKGHDAIDIVAPGLLISNSEVGMGALNLESGVYTLKCTNMANFGSKLRKLHIGSKADISQEVYALLSPETLTKTQEAFWAQVRDVMNGAFSPEVFQANCDKLTLAQDDQMDATRINEILEVVQEKFSWTVDETRVVLSNLASGGDITRYGLHAAVTRTAQDLPSYDRASEFERFGGQIIELNRSEWHRMAA